MTEENAVPTTPEPPDVVAAFRSALATVLPAEDLAGVDLDDVGAGTAMLSLPIDSEMLMALMTEMEDTFTVFIDEEAAFSFTTVGDLAEYVVGRVADKSRRLGGP